MYCIPDGIENIWPVAVLASCKGVFTLSGVILDPALGTLPIGAGVGADVGAGAVPVQDPPIWLRFKFLA